MAASGLAWHATAYLLGRAVILAATITLARVLTPSEFGVVSVAIVVIGFFEVIADFGVSQALIYLPASRQRNDAALLCSLISGAVFAALVAGFAGPLADALGSPESAPLLQVLSVSLVLTSLGLVPDMLLRRDLQFRRRLAVQLAMGGTRGVVTIALALSGLGVWALVFGYIAGHWPTASLPGCG